MAKRAFCVGINDYPYEGNDLQGCVNDAKAWAQLLVDHYDFAQADVQLITDAQATKANMVAGLKSLLKGAQAGDVLVFTNSSHGTYIADTSGDEPAYDEAICPYDCADNLLIDDELRKLFRNLRKGVQLTVISDSCFSGSVTRLVADETYTDYRRIRLLDPVLLGAKGLDDPGMALNKRKEKYPQSKMKEILLSGCSDSEYSYDALIGGVFHGAMTYYALQAIREANYAPTWQQLHDRLTSLITIDYPQHPQLEGKDANKQRIIFT